MELDVEQRLKRECAFRVALEVLRWHHARPVNPFQEISQLHLALHIGDFEEADRLIATGFERDKDAKGCWPDRA